MIGKIRFLFWIGIVMLFLPFFGMPDSWKVLAAIAIGLILIVISFSLRRGYKALKFKLRRYEQPNNVETEIHG